MSEERVNKKWMDIGIDKYSTAAILGTLAHYGVALDEASFKKAAEAKPARGASREPSGAECPCGARSRRRCDRWQSASAPRLPLPAVSSLSNICFQSVPTEEITIAR